MPMLKSPTQKSLLMLRKTIFLTLGLLWTATTFAQGNSPVTAADSTGMPGDNFSLEGALDLFKDAKSMEDFEQKLNSESNDVNNLDLNEDGEVDFVQVHDQMEGDVHAIILRVGVSEQESQDIAVIEIEKTGAESATLQILGDEEIYGETMIVEPLDVKEDGKANSRGPNPSELDARFVVVNVWVWPSVRFVYAPGYRPYVSAWRWGVRPIWWTPWRVRPWRHHWSHCAHYRAHHHRVHTHRVVHAHRIYTPHRRTSVIVVSRHRPARDHYRQTHVTVVHKPAPRNQVQHGGGRKGGRPGPRRK